MKKTLKIITFIIAFFMMMNIVNAKTNYIKLGEQIGNIRLHIKTPNVEKNKNIYRIINQNTNELVYCIEPGVMLYDGNFTEYSDISKTPLNITKEEWNYLTYIAFYGYNYRDRTDIKWYVATQFMIWDYLLGDSGEIYFIDEDDNKINLYQKEINAIQTDIDNMYILPSFAKTTYDPSNPQYVLKINEEITIEDTNNILSNFVVTANNNNVKPIVHGNKITVSFPASGDVLINYTKEHKNNVGKPKIFYSTTSQSVMSRGNVNMPSGVTQFKVLNPSFKLVKTASDQTNLSLEGATYGIYWENDNLSRTITTDSEGIAYLAEIYPGKYYLQEIEAPYGHQLNPEKIYFEVIDEDIVINTQDNLIKKNLKLEKYTLDFNGDLISEEKATFKIYDNTTNKLVKTITTDEYGKANILLSYGTYKIVQTKGKDGYTLMDNQIIKIDENFKEDESIVIKNEQIVGNIKIIKKDYETKEVITSPMSFKILNTDTNNFLTLNNETVFQTSDGIWESKNIPYGNYKIIEVTAPENYETLKENISFQITKPADNIELEIENKMQEGSLYIQKIDTDTKTPLPNVLFGLYNRNAKLIAQEYTNELGEVTISNLKVGTYYLKELETLENYEKDSNCYELVIKANATTKLQIENEKLNGTLNIIKIDKDTKEPISNILFGLYNANNELIGEYTTDDSGNILIEKLEIGTYTLKELKSLENYKENTEDIAVVIKSNEVTKIELVNEKHKGTLNITKIDKDTKEPLANVLFGLYNANNELIGKYTTDDDGNILIDNLEIGTYTLKELQTLENYKKNTEDIAVVIKSNEVTKIELTNEKHKGTLNLTKVDALTEIPLAGVEFALYNVHNELLHILTTDTNGNMEINDLPVGTYYLKELKTLENYEKDNNCYEIEIKANEITKIQIQNHKFKGTLNIIKIDKDTKEPLANVLFGLYNTNNELIVKECTNEEGSILIENLEVGTYILKELHGLENYKKNTEDIMVEIKNNEVTEINLTNEKLKGIITIIKLDALTKKALVGVQFGLYNADKELLQVFTTDTNGSIEKDLPIGIYYLKELLTLDNYELNDTEIEIEVKDNIKSTITLTNRTKIEVPKTGTSEFFVGFIISVFILLIGVYICNYDK